MTNSKNKSTVVKPWDNSRVKRVLSKWAKKYGFDLPPTECPLNVVYPIEVIDLYNLVEVALNEK